MTVTMYSSASKHAPSIINLRLTFAGRHALNPAVIRISVAGTSTILIPSTTRSATTNSPGFTELAAV